MPANSVAASAESGLLGRTPAGPIRTTVSCGTHEYQPHNNPTQKFCFPPMPHGQGVMSCHGLCVNNS